MGMTNLEATKALCTKICTGFYPDRSVLELSLIDGGVDPEAQYKAKDPDVAKAAIGIVKGMTETSHSEGGVSDAWDRESIKNNIRSICRNYGFDESEFVEVSTISDGSKYW